MCPVLENMQDCEEWIKVWRRQLWQVRAGTEAASTKKERKKEFC